MVQKSKCYRCTFRWQEGLRCGHRKMSSKESEKEKYPTSSKRTWQAQTAFIRRVGGSEESAAAWLQSELIPATRVHMLRKSTLQENQICAFVSVNICEFPPTSRCHTFTLKFLCGTARMVVETLAPEETLGYLWVREDFIDSSHCPSSW